MPAASRLSAFICLSGCYMPENCPDELAFIPIDERDMPGGLIHLVHTKGRVLPVAAAKFLDQLVQNLNQRFPEETR